MTKTKKKENFSPNGTIIIDGIKMESYKKELVSANILEIEVGTTGHMGGDSGNGGRTYFRISNLASTDMRCCVDNMYRRDADNIEISFGGDCELDTFCEALRIGYEVLKKYASPVDDILPTSEEKFTNYINDLCDLYRKQGTLRGMDKIRAKNHVTNITQQQFFQFDLDSAPGYVDEEFCKKIYKYILDKTKSTPIPKYEEHDPFE